jgi:hypothetical protein
MINVLFKKMIERRLEGEKYLVTQHHASISALIEAKIMPRFEYVEKELPDFENTGRAVNRYNRYCMDNLNFKAAKFMLPQIHSSLTIARGAVLRALEKTHGPTRFVRASCGILRHQPSNPGVAGAVRGKDGGYYLFNCLDWFIEKASPTSRQNFAC